MLSMSRYQDPAQELNSFSSLSIGRQRLIQDVKLDQLDKNALFQ